jgi:hypothetical protein
MNKQVQVGQAGAKLGRGRACKGQQVGQHCRPQAGPYVGHAAYCGPC